MRGFFEKWRKDSWLLVLLVGCIAACLAMGSSGAGHATDDELRLAAILSSIEGAGTVETAIFRTEDGRGLPVGAVIVAEGAGDVTVQLRLCRAAMTLLDLDADQILVCKLKEGGP